VTPAPRSAALSDQMLSFLHIAQYTNVNVNWGMASALRRLLLAATLVLYAPHRRSPSRK
jgi:putative spermidine/putrescine transport system permease protein